MALPEDSRVKEREAELKQLVADETAYVEKNRSYHLDTLASIKNLEAMLKRSRELANLEARMIEEGQRQLETYRSWLKEWQETHRAELEAR